jgi:hypothetical protein
MDFPEELLLELQSGDVILFLGAGLSKNSGLPDWFQLTKPLADAIQYRLPALEADINNEHLVVAAQYYENKFGRNGVVRYLRRQLDTTGISPSSAHYLLTLLPVKSIFTTNYDNLMERTYQDLDRQVNLIVDESDLAYWNENRVQIVKLCGDLARPGSIVLTKRDFNVYAQKRPRLVGKLRTTLETKTALFLGYGLHDPFLNQVWDSISFTFGAHQRPGYAVLFDPDPFEVDDLWLRGIRVFPLEGKEQNKSQVFTALLQNLIVHLADKIPAAQYSAVIQNIHEEEIIQQLARIETRLDDGS